MYDNENDDALSDGYYEFVAAVEATNNNNTKKQFNTINAAGGKKNSNTINNALHLQYMKRRENAISIPLSIPPEFQTEGGGGRKWTQCYVYETSTTPNHRIIHAITGASTSCRVGTINEELFFKVCVASGIDGSQTPHNLFFSDPAEYEKHMLQKLPQEMKTRWWERRMDLISRQTVEQNRLDDAAAEAQTTATFQQQLRGVVVK